MPFYAVKNGIDQKDHIFSTWWQTSKVTKGAKKCKFKKFETLEEAQEFLGHAQTLTEEKTPAKKRDITEVYTDGGAIHNGAPNAVAGLGVFFGDGHPQNLSLPLPGVKQTNNRAELLALLLGILGTDPQKASTVHTDSKYSIKASQNNVTEATANKDLIRLLKTALEDRPLVQLKHVYGHKGTHGNEEADRLATEAIKKAS